MFFGKNLVDMKCRGRQLVENYKRLLKEKSNMPLYPSHITDKSDQFFFALSNFFTNSTTPGWNFLPPNWIFPLLFSAVKLVYYPIAYRKFLFPSLCWIFIHVYVLLVYVTSCFFHGTQAMLQFHIPLPQQWALPLLFYF